MDVLPFERAGRPGGEIPPAMPGGGVPAAEPPRRGAAATVARLAVAGALVAWILGRSDLGEVGAAYRAADGRFLLLSLLLIPLGWIASALRWRCLLRGQGADARLGFLLRSFLAGVFFNNFLPSTIGGDSVRAYDTWRAGVPRGTAVAVIFADRFIGLVALVAFAVTAVLSNALPAGHRGLAAAVLLGAGAMSAACWLFYMPAGRLSGLAAALARRLPKRLAPFAGKLLGALLAFQGKGGVLARAFGLSLALQGLVVVNAWVLAKALRLPIPLSGFFLVVPLAIFLMMLPVSINAIGVRENVWAFFFAAYGLTASSALAFSWLDYGLVLLQAVIGGCVYAAGRRRPGSLSAGYRAPAAALPGGEG